MATAHPSQSHQDVNIIDVKRRNWLKTTERVWDTRWASAAQNAEQRCLSGARGAHQRQDLPRATCPRDVKENLQHIALVQ